MDRAAIQALNIGISAIKKLPKSEKNEEAIRILTELKIQNGFIKWDKEKICRVLDEWAEKNGRPPTTTHLTDPNMPNGNIIKLHFHMKASVFLRKRYGELPKKKYSKHPFQTKEEWVECFVEQFEKHDCQSGREYDRLRDPGTPSWYTIARYTQVRKWNDLMKLAGVSYSKPKRIFRQTPHDLSVQSSKSPSINKLEELLLEQKDLNEKLISIISIKPQ